jgi:hypothetical protein
MTYSKVTKIWQNEFWDSYSTLVPLLELNKYNQMSLYFVGTKLIKGYNHWNTL